MIMKKIIIILSTLLAVQRVNGNVNIITRSEWRASTPEANLSMLELPVGRVIVAHTAGMECNSKESCIEQVKNIQNLHTSKLGFDDISYNFLIGNDGNVYEGRGSDYQGAIAKGYNSGSINVAVIGNYANKLPSSSALEALPSLIESLVSNKKLKEDYKLYGHMQLSPTISPGSALFAEIQKMPKWTNKL